MDGQLGWANDANIALDINNEADTTMRLIIELVGDEEDARGKWWPSQ